MKKIIILALCAVSFAIAAPKKCVTFADTAGEGCWLYSRYSNGNPYTIYEVKGEQKVRQVCSDSNGYESGAPRCDKKPR